MGKGTEILRDKAKATTAQIDAALAGFSPEDLRDLAAEAVKGLAPASAEFFAKSDPAKSRVLRGLMAAWLDKRGAVRMPQVADPFPTSRAS